MPVATHHNSGAFAIRKEIIHRVVDCFVNHRESFAENVSHISFQMRPVIRNKESNHNRCCIYKDREIIRYRTMGVLGFLPDEGEDERGLYEYAQNALQRTEPSHDTIAVIDLACDSCIQKSYLVTETCRLCVARNCQNACRKNAISIDRKKHKAVIDPDSCVNCGKCMDACPYGAIIHVSIPCEEACPVDAIHKNEFGQRVINVDKCIDCGKCSAACPFGAVDQISHIVDIMLAVERHKAGEGPPVVAMLAPSIIGGEQDWIEIVSKLKAFGFADVVTVLDGAGETARREAAEIMERKHEGKPTTSSCCPAYVNLVDKHIPSLKPYVSTTPSPMVLQHEIMKARDNEKRIYSFWGPCVAKRREALKVGIDFTATFMELEGLLAVIPDQDVSNMVIPAYPKTIKFAYATGVTSSVADVLGDDAASLTTTHIDGLTRKTVLKLKTFHKKAMKGDVEDFLEVMSCEGGCIGGPCTNATREKASVRIKKVKVSDDVSL
ncbi:ferredoxin hydrogenase [Carpediemonas membranifera]|uniref:Ferredoxin hydrogenase n=1 Tax=Carpediemonas membranifera TaxID=201153 RepID=A0A8J6AXG0_9EUKA|nr:ferredoxin hydrogenase [Carpediemonas membranifera]|eukprot:KAG9397246.1 ferredoxin hydrogenase [Carpediemonas membranifera]